MQDSTTEFTVYLDCAARRLHRQFDWSTSESSKRVTAESFERSTSLRLPEQRKIARILSTVDDLIERTEALIAKYRAIKQGLMHDLLTRGVDASGRLRPPREEAPGLYRESAVGWVPREWEIRPVGDFTLSSSFGPRFPSSAYSENGNVATLRTTDLDDEGNIDFASMPLASLDTHFMQPHLLQIRRFTDNEKRHDWSHIRLPRISYAGDSRRLFDTLSL